MRYDDLLRQIRQQGINWRHDDFLAILAEWAQLRIDADSELRRLAVSEYSDPICDELDGEDELGCFIESPHS